MKGKTESEGGDVVVGEEGEDLQEEGGERLGGGGEQGGGEQGGGEQGAVEQGGESLEDVVARWEAVLGPKYKIIVGIIIYNQNNCVSQLILSSKINLFWNFNKHVTIFLPSSRWKPIKFEEEKIFQILSSSEMKV